MVGLLSLVSCCGSRPKMRNSVLEGFERQDIGRHQLVSYSVFKVSVDVMREIQS